MINYNDLSLDRQSLSLKISGKILFPSYENLKVNQTHFEGVNSGIFLEIHDSPKKRHQMFGTTVISSSGNVKYNFTFFSKRNENFSKPMNEHF